MSLFIVNSKSFNNKKAEALGASYKPQSVNIQDTFSRDWVDGWGATETGDKYDFSQLGFLSVNNGTGKISVPTTSGSVSTYLSYVSMSDTDMTMKITSDKASSTGNQYMYNYLRYTADSSGSGYGCFLKFDTGSNVVIQIYTRVAGSENLVTSYTIPSVVYTPGTFYQIRCQVSGNSPTTIKAKVWNASNAEPVGWNINTTDNTVGLQNTSGTVLVKDALGGGGSNTTFQYDNLYITDLISAGVLSIPSFTPVPTDSGVTLTQPSNLLLYPPDTTLTYNVSPSGISMPPYLTPVTDALHGTTIIRVSDQTVFGSSQQYIRNTYAKSPAWNADGSLILLGYTSASPILDGNNYQLLRTLNLGDFQSLWSNTNPNKLYGRVGNQFMSADVVTGVKTAIHTFSEYDSISIGDAEGNLSADDHYLAFQTTKGSENYLVIYDVWNDLVVSTKNIGIIWPDWISMSQSGNYVVVNWAEAGSNAGNGFDVYDRNLNFLHHIQNNSDHADLGYDTSGHEVLVLADASNSGDIISIRLDGAGVLGIANTYWTSTHVSCRALNRPGWCYVSDGSRLHANNGDNEIFAVKIDGSQTVERFADEHQTSGVPYAANAHAVPNKDGTRVMWGSPWDGDSSAPVYAYIAEYINNSTPTISSINTNTNSSGATIDWSVNKAGFHKIDYGLPSNLTYSSINYSSSQYNRTPSGSITGLLPCSSYQYRARSKDRLSNESIISTQDFTTSGCIGSANVIAQSRSLITNSAGGTFTLTDGGDSISINAPINFYGSNADFQIKKIQSSSAINSTGTPSSYNLIGQNIFDFKALNSAVSKIDSFVNPVGISIDYNDSEITNINENGLTIYNYSNGSWHPLSNCVVSVNSNKVTCSSNGSSVIGLFGQASVVLTPTVTSAPTTTPTSTLTPTATSIPTSIPTSTPTRTSSPTATRTTTSTTTPTSRLTPTPSAKLTPWIIITPSSTKIVTATVRATNKPINTITPTPTKIRRHGDNNSKVDVTLLTKVISSTSVLGFVTYLKYLRFLR